MPNLRPLGALLLAVSFGTAGCGSSVGTQVPTWAGGLPPEAPPRPAVQAGFPDVYAMPPPRRTRLMSEQEQARTEAELAAIRNRVNAQTNSLQKESLSGGR